MLFSVKTIRQAYEKQQWKDVINDAQKLLNSSSAKKEEKQETYLLLGSALRQANKLPEAIKALESGIKEFPFQGGLYHNLANCLREQKGENKWPIIWNYIKAQELGINAGSLAVSLARTYQDLSLSGLAYKTIFTWLKYKPAQVATPVDALTLLMELAGIVLEEADSERIGTWCVENLGELAKNSKEGQASLAIYKARLGNTKEANAWFQRARDSLMKEKEINLVDPARKKKDNDSEQSLINSGWNLACSLLKKGDMKSGWNLYEYGLQTPAPGLQRWQRALQKPYNSMELSIWDGDPLNGSKLLVIGEQAIGDTMMFLQLLPELMRESKEVILLLPPRLVPIYKRTYPNLKVYADDNLEELRNKERPDLQIPCGSIPSLRLEKWMHSGWDQVSLKTSPEKTESLRNQYRNELSDEQPLIGISWSGGGKASRMRAKSLTSEQFKEIFKCFPNARFISLQYGKAEATINDWKHAGYDVVYDADINALKDMDSWLSQVDACDAVISVANTTIHGAGTIKKPTFCLQGRSSDWRWIDGLNHSYWYETVNTSRQSRDGSWKDAIQSAQYWLHNQNEVVFSKPEVLKAIKEKASFSL